MPARSFRISVSSAAVAAMAVALLPCGAVALPVSSDAANARGAVRSAPIVQVSKRSKDPVAIAPTDMGGRYAVMREKRDTGCMLTLDENSRVRGGARAQLAPGCRDQGIVVFDPTAWQMLNGQLVLTARAGHKTHLQKSGVGLWQKDPKDGGKPLGLKKL